MKLSKILAAATLVTVIATPTVYAKTTGNGLPEQIAELQSSFTTFKDSVSSALSALNAANSSQQYDIASLKATIAQQQKEIQDLQSEVSNKTSAKETTITVKVLRDVCYGVWDGVEGTPLPNPVPPLVGANITVLNATGVKYTGTTDANGKVVFTVPEGIYSVRLEASSVNPSSYSIVETSVEHPASVQW